MKNSRIAITLCLSAFCLLMLVKLISSQAREGKTPLDGTQAGASQDANGNATSPATDLVIQCVAPPNTTMVAWYPFDLRIPFDVTSDTTTTAANLATGNAGTLTNGQIHTPFGKVSWALHFNGVNDFVASPSTIATNFGPMGMPATCFGSGLYSTCAGDFSMDAWIRLAANPPPGVMTILDKRDPTTNVGYHWFVQDSPFGSGNYQLGLQMNGVNFTSIIIPPPGLANGLWHHVAVTVSRIPPLGITFYHNGPVLGPLRGPAPTASLANDSPLFIGTRTASTPLSGWFSGDIDELEIFNRELTAPEVLSIYNAQQAGKCKTLVPRPPCPGCKHLSDFDGDGKDDFSVWRPSNGTWYSINSSNGTFVGTPWGGPNDKIVPGDYDGDGKTDRAIYRGGQWFIMYSSGSGPWPLGFAWGSPSDIPVPMDYDGDGKTDIAVWRPGPPPTWYIQLSAGGTNIVSVPSGNSTDIPVPDDYDGDCKVDLAVWRPSNGTWYLYDNSGNVIFTQQWGQAGDKPVPADYDGDGKADFAVWRNGTWLIMYSAGGTAAIPWGVSTDKPLRMDVDGDCITDIAVFRPSTGTWYVRLSTTGVLVAQNWGAAGDIPVPGAYIP